VGVRGGEARPASRHQSRDRINTVPPRVCLSHFGHPRTAPPPVRAKTRGRANRLRYICLAFLSARAYLHRANLAFPADRRQATCRVSFPIGERHVTSRVPWLARSLLASLSIDRTPQRRSRRNLKKWSACSLAIHRLASIESRCTSSQLVLAGLPHACDRAISFTVHPLVQGSVPRWRLLIARTNAILLLTRVTLPTAIKRNGARAPRRNCHIAELLNDVGDRR